jgi:hypothetical protein
MEFILAPEEEDLEAGLGLVGGGCEALGWGFEGSDGAISACMVSICMTGVALWGLVVEKLAVRVTASEGGYGVIGG